MPDENKLPLANDAEHTDKTHNRWATHRNRIIPQTEDELPDEYYNQCGECIYYIPLQGMLSSDWGVCSNSASTFDRQAMWEHDGCDNFTRACKWVSSYLSPVTMEP